jgi:hypothetical protein
MARALEFISPGARLRCAEAASKDCVVGVISTGTFRLHHHGHIYAYLIQHTF